MEEFCVKRVAIDSNCYFRVLVISFETVSCYPFSDILFPIQKQCYVLISIITKFVEIQQPLKLISNNSLCILVKRRQTI